MSATPLSPQPNAAPRASLADFVQVVIDAIEAGQPTKALFAARYVREELAEKSPDRAAEALNRHFLDMDRVPRRAGEQIDSVHLAFGPPDPGRRGDREGNALVGLYEAGRLIKVVLGSEPDPSRAG